MCCYAPILYNDKVYQIGQYEIYEIIDGQYTNYRYHGGNIGDLNDIKVIDGKVYFNTIQTTQSPIFRLMIKDRVILKCLDT